MTKWEYIRPYHRDTEGILTWLERYGQDGWELCVYDGNGTYIFKRPLQQQSFTNPDILGEA